MAEDDFDQVWDDDAEEEAARQRLASERAELRKRADEGEAAEPARPDVTAVASPASAAADALAAPIEAPLPRKSFRRRLVSATARENAGPDFTRPTAFLDVPSGNVEKLGIVGGKGVGKSYLFQAMVYRTISGRQSGALTYYLAKDGLSLYSSSAYGEDMGPPENLAEFVKHYSRWWRIEQTKLTNQRWYRLRLGYRTGWLGRTRSAMDVEFFDGSGEGFFEAGLHSGHLETWLAGYAHARVMVFCLPLWVAFPGAGLGRKDWDKRDACLKGFQQVVENYAHMRALARATHPVRTILALTMADDPRSSLATLRRRWIEPYMETPKSYLDALRHGRGIATYLANARKVSEILDDEFAASRDPLVGQIPQKLDFDAGTPWLVPVSAIEGQTLDQLDAQYADPEDYPRLQAPVPVHVELPLLVALCERHNALM